LLIIAFVTLLLPADMQAVKVFFERLIGGIDPSLAGYAILIVAALALVLSYVGKRRSIIYAWVECKDTKSNIKRAQVQKLISSAEDVRQNKDAKWKPTVLMMVSGSDFDADALNFADEYGIECFRRSGKGFEEVT